MDVLTLFVSPEDIADERGVLYEKLRWKAICAPRQEREGAEWVEGGFGSDVSEAQWR